jgi:hypothetical protein
MLARPIDIAEFFWQLLGPSRRSYNLLDEATLEKMMTFVQGSIFGDYHGASCGYGLGLMNFSNMTWGFQDPNQGLFYGHNGLTYGFGSQSGYNAKYVCCVCALPAVLHLYVEIFVLT